MELGLPYLRAIGSNIQDAFPGRKVSIWSQPGLFCPVKIAIIARVDDAGAYTVIDANIPESEADISDILIAKLREVLE